MLGREWAHKTAYFTLSRLTGRQRGIKRKFHRVADMAWSFVDIFACYELLHTHITTWEMSLIPPAKL